MRDVAKWPAVEPEGTPGRALAMLRHRLTGRLRCAVDGDRSILEMVAPNLHVWRIPDGAFSRRGRGLHSCCSPAPFCCGKAAPAGERVCRRRRAPRLATPAINLAPIPDAPSADPKNKEQKRFDRADKNKNGTITLAELVEPRRKPFAKLDLNRDGKLSFEEWAVKTIDKFKTADADQNGGLTRAEYATTAPKPKAKKPECACDRLARGLRTAGRAC